MKTLKFNYEKNPEEITPREVVVLDHQESYIDGIDISHLSSEEIEKLGKIQKDYEEALEPFVKKAYRRFSRSKIKEI